MFTGRVLARLSYGFEASNTMWSSGVYVAPALGTYAAYLGLNERAVLRAFDDEYGTTSDPIRSVSTSRIDEEKRLSVRT